jgi:hypothetical protein
VDYGGGDGLAQAWVDVTVTQAQARDQNLRDFWQPVKTHFHLLLGCQERHRTTNMLMSKWRDMRLKSNRFRRFLDAVDKDFWDTEDEQLEEAQREYLREEGHPFTYMEARAIVKSHRDFSINPAP